MSSHQNAVALTKELCKVLAAEYISESGIGSNGLGYSHAYCAYTLDSDYYEVVADVVVGYDMSEGSIFVEEFVNASHSHPASIIEEDLSPKCEQVDAKHFIHEMAVSSSALFEWEQLDQCDAQTSHDERADRCDTPGACDSNTLGACDEVAVGTSTLEACGHGRIGCVSETRSRIQFCQYIYIYIRICICICILQGVSVVLCSCQPLKQTIRRHRH